VSKLETLEKRTVKKLQKRQKNFASNITKKKTRKGRWGQPEDEKLWGKDHEKLWGNAHTKFNYGIWKEN